MTINNNSSGFAELGVAPRLLEILSRHKITTPTPIQKQSIPIAIQGKDVMGIAQTGTGKTFAFGLPMIQRLAQSQGRKGLILVPTRELALQVDENLRMVGSALKLKTAVLIGGEAMSRQIRALRGNPHVIVATPGRMNDHLENSKLDLSVVSILVLDEADRMLDMGFEPQIKKILARVPKVRQTMLFSATMPTEIVNIANSYMKSPLRVEVAPAGTAASTVSQELYFCNKQDKNDLLKSVLTEYKGSALVFTRTKYKARDVARAVRSLGHTSTEIHSNRSLPQRREALDGFKVGKYRVMVATDIAARGIDVTGIELVINYDLPENPEDYVHRIGRTGRAGLTGHAISFATHDQKYEVKSIERLLKKPLSVAKSVGTPERSEGFKERPGRFSNRRNDRSRFQKSDRPRKKFKGRIQKPSSQPDSVDFNFIESSSNSAEKPRNSRGGFSNRKYFGDRKSFGDRKFNKNYKGKGRDRTNAPRDDFKKPRPGLSSGVGFFIQKPQPKAPRILDETE